MMVGADSLCIVSASPCSHPTPEATLMPMTFPAVSRTLLALAAGASLLSACATPYNSGISEKAPNTYFLQIRTPNKDGGSEESLRKAKIQADEFCARSGKTSEITSQELGPVTADVFFTCGG
jgi:hypothetical protein